VRRWRPAHHIALQNRSDVGVLGARRITSRARIALHHMSHTQLTVLAVLGLLLVILVQRVLASHLI